MAEYISKHAGETIDSGIDTAINHAAINPGNPHGTTKDDIGLGNVQNTDLTPQVTAAQSAANTASINATAATNAVQATQTQVTAQDVRITTLEDAQDDFVKFATSGYFYVNGTTGNDTNDGSSSSPVKTITRAMEIVGRLVFYVPPGTLGAIAIDIAEGTYDEAVYAVGIHSKLAGGQLILTGMGSVTVRRFEFNSSRVYISNIKTERIAAGDSSFVQLTDVTLAGNVSPGYGSISASNSSVVQAVGAVSFGTNSAVSTGIHVLSGSRMEFISGSTLTFLPGCSFGSLENAFIYAGYGAEIDFSQNGSITGTFVGTRYHVMAGASVKYPGTGTLNAYLSAGSVAGTVDPTTQDSGIVMVPAAAAGGGAFVPIDGGTMTGSLNVNDFDGVSVEDDTASLKAKGRFFADATTVYIRARKTSSDPKGILVIEGGVPGGNFASVDIRADVFRHNAQTVWDNGTLPKASTNPTITLAGSTTPGVFTYATKVARYHRIGNLVLLSFWIEITAVTTPPAGDLRITGLPFPAISSGVHTSGSVSSFGNIQDYTASDLGVMILSGASVINFIGRTGVGTSEFLAASRVLPGFICIGSITYEIA